MKAVVFDFGGVVFRWQPLSLLQEVVPHHAHDDDSARALAARLFQSFAVGSDWAEFDRGTVTPGELVERIARRTGLPAQDVERVVHAIPPHLQAQAGTVTLMQRLREAGHRLFYLSNMPAPYADHLERHHGFFDWFEGGVFSARVGLIKPEPAIFDLAVLRFGVQPAECVFVDDVLHNVEAARAAGWQAVHFIDAPQCEGELRALGVG